MIDVSEYQGTIDWDEAYKAGVRKAYIKCSEGRTMSDPFCRKNVHNARRANVQIGLYHYAHPSNSPMSDWRNFLEASHGLILPGDLPPALDLEITEGHSWASLNDWKSQWLHNADALIGVPHGAVFYSYFYFLKNMVLWNDRPIWGAAYTADSNFTVPLNWNIWQYTAHGSIAGVKGNVDCDKVLKQLKPVHSGH